MDLGNVADMNAIRPEEAATHSQLMLDFSDRYEQSEVPDPYFGNDGFDLVFDMIDDASRGLLRHIRAEHNL